VLFSDHHRKNIGPAFGDVRNQTRMKETEPHISKIEIIANEFEQRWLCSNSFAIIMRVA